ncbi:MAG TPA: hypothetical protein VMU58_13695 [Gaiellaceae bacterium]|nr:hypothetical protein [Gaiellaceae bacterium]
MKRLIPLALAVLALAAVPAAFADNGTAPTPPATGSAPAAQQGRPGQGAQNARQRLQLLRQRVQRIERRFGRRCGSSSTGAPQGCLDFAQKVEARLTKLDGNIQARIAKIQQTCSTASTDPKCANADKRIARLQAIDTRVQTLAQKVQDWIDGKTVSTSGPAPGSSSDSSSLDQAAAGLGQLAQQAGGTK